MALLPTLFVPDDLMNLTQTNDTVRYEESGETDEIESLGAIYIIVANSRALLTYFLSLRRPSESMA